MSVGFNKTIWAWQNQNRCWPHCLWYCRKFILFTRFLFNISDRITMRIYARMQCYKPEQRTLIASCSVTREPLIQTLDSQTWLYLVYCILWEWSWFTVQRVWTLGRHQLWFKFNLAGIMAPKRKKTTTRGGGTKKGPRVSVDTRRNSKIHWIIFKVRMIC